MNRLHLRFAAAITAVAMAAAIAAPALAAVAPSTAPSPRNAASTDTGVGRCAAEWRALIAHRTVASEQAAGECEIDRRLDTLDRLRRAVDGSGVLTADHAASLHAILASSESGLTDLRATIAGDTTLAAVTADVRRVFTDYRVYVLVARQAILVTADDRVDTAADRLAQAADRLAAAIAQAQANGRDTTAAQGHLDAMNAAISSARQAVDADAADVLALTPAGWNAGSAKPVLDAARTSVSTARTDLITALREARATLVALR